MSDIPADLRYSRDDLWARLDAATGLVRTDNDALTRTPELVNTDPYGQGWMFEAELDPSRVSQQLASPLDARAYRDLAGE